jgi:hypothetical protein
MPLISSLVPTALLAREFQLRAAIQSTLNDLTQDKLWLALPRELRESVYSLLALSKSV